MLQLCILRDVNQNDTILTEPLLSGGGQKKEKK